MTNRTLRAKNTKTNHRDLKKTLAKKKERRVFKRDDQKKKRTNLMENKSKQSASKKGQE